MRDRLAAHSMLQLTRRISVGARAGWLAAGATPVRFLVSPTLAIGL